MEIDCLVNYFVIRSCINDRIISLMHKDSLNNYYHIASTLCKGI